MKFLQWLTRIKFYYRWPESRDMTEDIAAPAANFTEWKETIRYYLNYCNEHNLHIVKVHGLLAFIAYSMMKRRY